MFLDLRIQAQLPKLFPYFHRPPHSKSLNASIRQTFLHGVRLFITTVLEVVIVEIESKLLPSSMLSIATFVSAVQRIGTLPFVR